VNGEKSNIKKERQFMAVQPVDYSICISNIMLKFPCYEFQFNFFARSNCATYCYRHQQVFPFI